MSRVIATGVQDFGKLIRKIVFMLTNAVYKGMVGK